MLEYGSRRDVGLFHVYTVKENVVYYCTVLVAILQEDKDSTRDLN